MMSEVFFKEKGNEVNKTKVSWGNLLKKCNISWIFYSRLGFIGVSVLMNFLLILFNFGEEFFLGGDFGGIFMVIKWFVTVLGTVYG